MASTAAAASVTRYSMGPSAPVGQRQSQWTQNPYSVGSNPTGGTTFRDHARPTGARGPTLAGAGRIARPSTPDFLITGKPDFWGIVKDRKSTRLNSSHVKIS